MLSPEPRADRDLAKRPGGKLGRPRDAHGPTKTRFDGVVAEQVLQSLDPEELCASCELITASSTRTANGIGGGSSDQTDISHMDMSTGSASSARSTRSHVVILRQI